MANENSPAKPPPWFIFRPTDTRLIRTFLIPRIRGQDLPMNDFARRDVFADPPLDLAIAEGYSEEKQEIYFFNQTSRRTPHWKPTHRSEDLIKSGDTVIGRKKKFYHAQNPGKTIKWYLDQYTAEGENSDVAVYKLHTGREPAQSLYTAEAQNQNLTVPPPQSGSSLLPVLPCNPPLLQQEYSQWNHSLQHNGSSPLLQQAYSPWNPMDLQAFSQWNESLPQHNGSSALPLPEWNPPLPYNGLSSLPLPQGNPPFLQQDNTQTGFPTDWSESGLLQQILYSNQPTNQSQNPLPQGNPPFLQQDNTQTGFPTDGSAVLSFPTQQYVFQPEDSGQHLQEASTAGNPVLQDGSALPPYPSQQDAFQPEDSGHLGSQQILHANIQGNPQNIFWSDFYQYYLTQLHNNPNANTNNDQPSSSNPPEH
uniref:uncharacterized protein LOC105353406 n=1 Tax=Fragaria vesca subsp. vesca TaxID=101020 RepID=UPI0005C912A1|nr:PREDICTED: uncharacterized protein LOC105353406 [Fragaria vesca subsp. vesca]